MKPTFLIAALSWAGPDHKQSLYPLSHRPRLRKWSRPEFAEIYVLFFRNDGDERPGPTGRYGPERVPRLGAAVAMVRPPRGDAADATPRCLSALRSWSIARNWRSDRHCNAACKRELSVGRGSGIRTRDPLLPKQVLYQAELCPDISRTSTRSAPLRASPRLARRASPPPSSMGAPGSESRPVA